jgi:hypothetical protein
MSTKTINVAMKGIGRKQEGYGWENKWDGMSIRTMHGAINGMRRLRGRRMGGWKVGDVKHENVWVDERDGKETRRIRMRE